MTIRVLAFASLRDALGMGEVTLTLPEAATGTDLLDALEADHPRFGPFRRTLRLAVNGRYTRGDALLADGDEVALITPTSGG
ncbi:MAG: MoaD/ThiS family protein [Bacteroidota bacterium]